MCCESLQPELRHNPELKGELELVGSPVSRSVSLNRLPCTGFLPRILLDFIQDSSGEEADIGLLGGNRSLLSSGSKTSRAERLPTWLVAKPFPTLRSFQDCSEKSLPPFASITRWASNCLRSSSRSSASMVPKCPSALTRLMSYIATAAGQCPIFCAHLLLCDYR